VGLLRGRDEVARPFVVVHSSLPIRHETYLAGARFDPSM
jgi:hypothetical protein